MSGQDVSNVFVTYDKNKALRVDPDSKNTWNRICNVEYVDMKTDA